MMLDTLRRIRMITLVLFIVGGLWLLADWRANLSEKAPAEFAKPTWDLHKLAQAEDKDSPSVLDRIKRDLPGPGVLPLSR